jgi:hypothetical protein
MQPSFARYLLYLGGSLLAVLLMVWVYTALAPMAFMESGYAAWAAKSAMLKECRLGQLAFFGDSRLESGVAPAALPVDASNFGLAAGTAVETHSAVRRAMACPAVPRQAVIALVPEHFGPLSKFFWILSVRYGFLSPGEVYATERLASRLGDANTLATPTPDGLRGPVRDWLYAIRFPSLSFGSLVQGRVFGRYASNTQRYAATLRSRGWAEYAGGEAVPADPADAFTPTKLQAAEFEAALERLRARGVEVFLLVMPFAQSHREPPGVFAGYLDYLGDVTRRFPGVHLLGHDVPIWPDRFFADGAHLDGAGAKAFSERLAACITNGRLQPPCNLDWHPAASAARAGSTVLEVQKESDRQH